MRLLPQFVLATILGGALSTLPLQVSAADLWSGVFKSHLKEAKAGDAEAQYEIGAMYLSGDGIKADRGKARTWLDKAAIQGEERAKQKLSRMAANEKKFAKLKIAAEAGKADAQYKLGMQYLNGKGVSISGVETIKWLKAASVQGHAKASTRLGIVYLKGENIKTNYREARRYFNSVADSNVLAQYYLGEIYAQGKGVKLNRSKAVQWYQRAADGGFHRAGGKIIHLQEEMKIEKWRIAHANSKKAEAARKAEQLRLATAQAKKDALVASKVVVIEPKKSLVKKTPSNKSRKTGGKKVIAKKPVKVTPKVTTQKIKIASATPLLKKAAKAKPVKKVVKRKIISLKTGKITSSKSSPTHKWITRLAKNQWLRNSKPVYYLPSTVTGCETEGEKLVCLTDVLERTTGDSTVQFRVKSIVEVVGKRVQIGYKNLVLDVFDNKNVEANGQGYGDESDKGFKVKTGWSKKHILDCSPVNKSNQLKCIKNKVQKVTLVAG